MLLFVKYAAINNNKAKPKTAVNKNGKWFKCESLWAEDNNYN